MKAGPRPLVARADGRGEPDCKPAKLDAEHPLFILYTSGDHRQAQGHPPHHGRLSDPRHDDLRRRSSTCKDEDTYWCTADIGWITGHSYVVYGDPGERRHDVMYEGTPTHPGPDRWWDIIERLGRHASSTRRRRRSGPSSASATSTRSRTTCRRCDCSARWGSRSTRGVDVVPPGDRRQALPDRRHLVADRDGRDHDHAAARRRRTPSPARPRCPSPAWMPAAMLDEDGKEVKPPTAASW